jgi:octaprenyl-diphosphate synthase
MNEVAINGRNIRVASGIDAVDLFCPMPIVHRKIELGKMNSNQFNTHLGRINEELEKLISSRAPSFLNDTGSHSLLGNGKCLLPLFFVLSSKLCNYPEEDVFVLSTIFEHIHRASLLHEGVVDNVRDNGKKGNDKAILEGDFLYSKASTLGVDSNNMPFLKRIIETTTQMMEGQILDLIHTDDWDTDREQYMEVITSRKAILFSAACVCGAIISGSKGEAAQSLEKFGLNIGIAFQLMEDLLDYRSSEDGIGKKVGKALKKGRITLPLIYTLSKLEDSVRERLVNFYKNHQATEQDYRNLIWLVMSNGVLGQIQYEVQSYIDKATSCLSTFPDSTAKRDLLELAHYVIE